MYKLQLFNTTSTITSQQSGFDVGIDVDTVKLSI